MSRAAFSSSLSFSTATARPWRLAGAAFLAALTACAATLAAAQSVSLAGLLGGKALLVVDGGAPKAVAVGERFQGVKLLSAEGDRAVVEVGGARLALRMGEVPLNVSSGGTAASSGGRIVMPAGSGGHFSGPGLINGRPVMMLVDTGATTVAIGLPDAERIGLNYKTGTPVKLTTANGTAIGWRTKLGSLRLGDVDVYDVDAIVTPGPMPYVLLGNSFLTRFQMNRASDQLVLVKRF
jgi:aspartyl protease family protein